MKTQPTHRWLLLLATLISILPLSAHAHPGHGLAEGGLLHSLTSPDHLAMLGGAGLVAWCLGLLLRRQPIRKALQYGGTGAMAVAAILWSIG